MKSKNFILIIAVVIIVAVVVVVQRPKEQTEDLGIIKQGSIEIGKEAPDFMLESLDGNVVKLSDYRDRAVIVNFWATWCPFCLDEMPAFQEIYEENDVVVLGVNLQENDLERVESYVNDLGVTYPILLDPNAEVKKAYNVITQPVTYYIDKNGIIVDRKLGPLTEEELQEKADKLLNKKAEVKGTIQDEIMVTDGVKHIVDLEKLRWGCPRRDCIPSIDNPKFDDGSWLDDEDLVLGIVHEGEARAYPHRILNWHEIVNDEIKGDAVLISYCPLCDTGIAFERTIDNEAVEFGVSGRLLNSDLVMYDRKTETLWDQIGGRAIVGELTGMKLKMLPLDTVMWKDWKKAHPDTLVLSKDTGFSRDYSKYPYGNYRESEDVFFPVDNKDERLHEKARIQGIKVNGIFKAYSEDAIEREKVINDEVNGKRLLIVMDPVSKGIRIFERNDLEFKIDGGKLMDNKGREWSFNGEGNGGRLKLVDSVGAFWFAWTAFNPSTELYK